MALQIKCLTIRSEIRARVGSLNLLFALLTACTQTVNYTGNPDPYLLATRLASRQEYDKAVPIWQELSQNGDCDANWQLGVSYFFGYGVRADTVKAVFLWTDAAERGQPRAAMALGDVYFRNPNDMFVCSETCAGIARDPPKAYKWYLISQRGAWYQPDVDYLKRVMPHIRDALSDSQRASTEAEAASWKPGPIECKPRRSI